MALVVNDNKKVFEKPASGQYLGVLADVIDLGIVPTTFGPKPKCRLVWLLANIDGSGFTKDSEGNPLRVMGEYNASMNEKADLYKTVRSVLGVPPPVPYDIEQLIGRNNLLFIILEKSKDGTKEYANVKGILPSNLPVLAVPPTFKRYTPKTNGTVAQATAAQNVQPVAQPAPAPFVAAQPVQAVAQPVAVSQPAQAVAQATVSPIPTAQAGAPVALDQSF